MFRTISILILLAFASTSASMAQAPSGQASTVRSTEANSAITGIVRDSSGGTVPGATVRVINEGTRLTVEAVTDEQGL